MSSQSSSRVYLHDKDKNQWYKVQRGLLGGLYLEKTEESRVDLLSGQHLAYTDSRTVKEKCENRIMED